MQLNKEIAYLHLYFISALFTTAKMYKQRGVYQQRKMDKEIWYIDNVILII